MIYLDTNIIIYAIENHPKYGDKCTDILRDIEFGKLKVHCSILVLVEVLNVLTKLNKLLSKENKQLDIRKNIEAILSLPITWLDLDFFIIKRAAEYNYAVSGVDYIHAASMEIHSLKQIISADSELDKIDFIKRIDPLKYKSYSETSK